jgi:hypothetical protein
MAEKYFQDQFAAHLGVLPHCLLEISLSANDLKDGYQR